MSQTTFSGALSSRTEATPRPVTLPEQVPEVPLKVQGPEIRTRSGMPTRAER
ncbi:MAG TPA: hypothetical protein VK401_09245 [Propionibacteriaceae bacterium]|nr:hypothetical protein [Propionibacteriaceae bacterium]